MEPGRSVATAARTAPRRTPGRGQTGPVPGRHRFLPRSGCQTWPKSGPSPVDRARPGSKHHVLTEGAGIPLAASLTGGNPNDVTELLPLIDKVAPVRGRPRP